MSDDNWGDVAAFIRRYDRPGTLFYCDPPYVGSEGYYGKALFGSDDLDRLATVLTGIQVRFILSNLDCPEVRIAFVGCEIREVKTRYSCVGGSDRDSVGEVGPEGYAAKPCGALHCMMSVGTRFWREK
ncbi:DNA adenine methylase [Magnetospirillum fulvum]|uniref:D12 class N6 adenine-specific DNA methyltransferase n=1 Tax=Magnetospirillum fulvum TaxID=1082 RepID=A0A1H6I3R8_MAGFU|nr:DNA adenine methylase [Magnetospirillum fulvum]SEH41072.1 D12 class N6 adenine-specific DNA methyltransferase [Magnetospirillum fulvum]